MKTPRALHFINQFASGHFIKHPAGTLQAPVRGKGSQERVRCSHSNFSREGTNSTVERKGLAGTVAGDVGGYNGAKKGRLDGKVEGLGLFEE